jgi:hypothetical protein
MSAFTGSVRSTTRSSGEGVLERTGEAVASLALSSVIEGVDSVLDSRLIGGRRSLRRSLTMVDEVGGNDRFLVNIVSTGDPGGVILAVET